MKNFLKFFLEINKIKGRKRRGWEIHKFKNPETTTEHTFSLAVFVWMLGKDKKINIL